MPIYLLQATYAPEAWQRMVDAADGTMMRATVLPIVKKLGGTFIDRWFAFGKYDIVVVLDMPDNVSAAAVSIALSSSGNFKAIKTTPLMMYEEGREALEKVRKAGFKRPRR